MLYLYFLFFILLDIGKKLPELQKEILFKIKLPIVYCFKFHEFNIILFEHLFYDNNEELKLISYF